MRGAVLQGSLDHAALPRVTSLLLLRQRLFRGAERRAPAQAFARHAGEEPHHALAAFQIEPQSRLQAVRRAGVADASDAVAEGIVAAALRSEEHTTELQSLMRIQDASYC